jgi:hypothetical protein
MDVGLKKLRSSYILRSVGMPVVSGPGPAGRPQNGLWLALVGLLVVFRLIPFLPAGVNSFAASHYLFSYHGGFHKRALPGAVLASCLDHVSSATIYAVSLGTLAGFVIALMLLIRKPLLSSKTTLVLGLTLLGAAAILPHFAYSLGYFDPILVICAVLARGALGAPVPDWLKVTVAFAFCAIGILTHEIFILAAFPLVIARTLVSEAPRTGALWVLAILVAAATVVVQIAGQPVIPLDEYMTQASARTDFKADVEAFGLLYFHPGENFSYLVEHYSNVLTDARLLAGLLVPIPYFLLLLDLFQAATAAAAVSYRTKLMICACIFAPLLLMLGGFDALRWVSFACLNCSLLIFEYLRGERAEAVEEALRGYVLSARFVILALLTYSLGALHVVDGNAIATGIHSLARGLQLVQW